MSRPTDLGSVKEGSYILIDGEPCRIVEYDKSKPGKHGSAKARVVGIGLFDNVKRTMVSPVASNIEVPMIEKKSGQVISLAPNNVQIMDLQTFAIFDVPMPLEEEIKSKLAAGMEIEYWEGMGKKKIMRTKGG